jgi:hypothetical protein
VFLAVVTLLYAAPLSVFAQPPETGPAVLHVPSSARTAALAGAWVAGRDQDVVFHNPAQLIGTRSGFDLSAMRLGPGRSAVSLGSVFAAGKYSLTFGWGAQLLHDSGSRALVAAGAAIVVKKFRVGVTAKYASEVSTPSAHVLLPVTVNHHILMADVGVARNLFGGAAALAFQNLGRDSKDNGGYIRLPRQVALGWSTTKVAGPFDVGVFTQVAARRHWVAPAAGVEVGYSWIEGYNLVLRAGARRPETGAEQPVSLGAAFTADRLTVEYSVRFRDGGRTENGVTLRWR